MPTTVVRDLAYYVAEEKARQEASLLQEERLLAERQGRARAALIRDLETELRRWIAPEYWDLLGVVYDGDHRQARAILAYQGQEYHLRVASETGFFEVECVLTGQCRQAPGDRLWQELLRALLDGEAEVAQRAAATARLTRWATEPEAPAPPASTPAPPPTPPEPAPPQTVQMGAGLVVPDEVVLTRTDRETGEVTALPASYADDVTALDELAAVYAAIEALCATGRAEFGLNPKPVPLNMSLAKAREYHDKTAAYLERKRGALATQQQAAAELAAEFAADTEPPL